MKLIVGLGNPGKKYESTRHNLGFWVLDELLRKLTLAEEEKWQEAKKLRARIHKLKTRTILLKPQTMMNNSGIAVARSTRFYKIKPENIWVIHDEIDLPLGKIKIIKNRGSAGHKGVESVIKELGTNEFIRLRLGIGRPEHDFTKQEAETFVLSPFGKGERSKARGLIKKTVKAIEMALEEGIEKAMSRFNQ